MNARRLFSLIVFLSFVIFTKISLAQDYDSMFEGGGDEGSPGAAEGDKSEAGDASEPSEDAKGDKADGKSAKEGEKVEVSTKKGPEKKRKTEMQGNLQPYAGLGYGLPIMDMTHHGMLQDTPHMGAGSAGALPIFFGLDYMIIDRLPIGLRFKFTPCFITNTVDDVITFIFDLHVLAGFYVWNGIKVYSGIGISKQYISSSADFTIPIGVSYTLYLKEIATKGAFGLDFGIEMHMSFGKDYKSTTDTAGSDPGTLADKMFIYPLLYVAARFTLPVGK